MANFDSVKVFANRAAMLERLDVVIENAGVAKEEFVMAEGLEMNIAVNVVGMFLLALNLMPILRKSGQQHGVVPRLVILTSAVHFHGSSNSSVSCFIRES